MKLHILLISLLVGVSVGVPYEFGGSQEEKQSLAIEELRQNLTALWAEVDGLKASLEAHAKESDPQFYYDPSDHSHDHHDDHHGHEGGDYHGDHHHDYHGHDHDHHHDGDNQTVDAKEGRNLESGYDHAYDDHHYHHEYDHHHHDDSYHHDHHYDDHHHQDNRHDHHHDDDDHHHDDRDGDSKEKDKKDSHSEEDDNSEENVVVGKTDKKSESFKNSPNDSPQPGGEGHHHDHGYHHSHQRHHRQREEFYKAQCHLLPNSEVPESNVTGHITITQSKKATGPLFFKIYIKGFDVSKEEGLGYVHGFHVHENEILGQKCSSAGPHFNPLGSTHGAPYDVVRHVGDLGNIRVDDNGRFENRVISDDIVSFFGKRSIIGRSIVVHQKADDLGLGGDEESLKTGNAGARLACCTIEGINLPTSSRPVIRFNG